MTIEEIKQMIHGPDYNFLWNDINLGKNIMFLTLGGSYSYGTNIETSDVDVRGCALNRKSDLIGLTDFDQYVSTATDTTVYGFNKLAKLLLNCNPNTIEMLGCKPEHYFYITPRGQQMIDNRKLFLSQRAVNSFGGYATQQLRRLENALARGRMPQERKEEHIRNSMESAIKNFENHYTRFEHGSIVLHLADSKKESLDKEIVADIHIDSYPAREFNTILSHLTDVLGTYEKLSHRNHKKDEEHLDKHAMHLIRLYLMCLDILENGDIVTYREKDHDTLMEIRRGKYRLEDGNYDPVFFEMLSEYEKRLQYAKQHTNLPPHPDMERVQEFVMDINSEALR